MKPLNNSVWKILGIVLIAGAGLRYCVPPGRIAALVPLGGGKSASPPSHARAKAEGPVGSLVNAFKSPIRIYGRVVNQHGKPVPGATVSLSPVTTFFGGGSGKPELVLTTDGKGEFSAEGLHGFSMGVRASKEGYLYISPLGGPSSSAMLTYSEAASDGNRHNNPATPLILKLHEIGPEDPMIFIDEKRRSLPVDGTVKRIALDTEKGNGPHQIELRFKTDWVNNPGDNEHFEDQFDWTFEMRIPGGGFVWCDNDYIFEAPEYGYKERVRLEYKAGMTREEWKKNIWGQFFVKFPDGCHGRIRLSVDGIARAGDSPIMLGSWLNLKPGSRNLATRYMNSSSASDERYRREWKW